MCGFLGGGTDAADAGPPLFEIRDSAGPGSDLLIRSRELGAALAATLGGARLVLMRGHGCTVVAESVRVAVYRAVYAEMNAQLLLQTLPLGEPVYLTAAEAEAARRTCEGQIDRPWNLWKQQARQPEAKATS
jgi:HCOMODA/2-hydroxy-3-carboxy-muconic semialdehyde decarboxylase